MEQRTQAKQGDPIKTINTRPIKNHIKVRNTQTSKPADNTEHVNIHTCKTKVRNKRQTLINGKSIWH